LFPQKIDQLELGSEAVLFAGIYFLDESFQMTSHALADVPKLNHK